MKENEIERFMREHRDAFNHHEPLEGHMERFWERLEHRHIARRPFRMVTLLRVAAILILVLISALWIYERFTRPVKLSPEMSLGDISQEYREVEIYYGSLVNMKYEELENIDFEGDTLSRLLILKEMKDMDSIYVNLRKELSLFPKDQRVVDAIIVHYERKVEVLNRILDQLSSIKQKEINSKKDENTEL